MTHRSPRRIVTILLTVAAATVALAQPASAAPYAFAGPVFGLAAGPGDVLFAADAGAGVVRHPRGRGRARRRPARRHGHRPGEAGSHVGDRREEAVQRSTVTASRHFLAGLGKFERIVNPDGGEVDSNPFDVTALGTKRALIADAGANAVLVANRRGGVNWIATLPDELVPTDNVKTLVRMSGRARPRSAICRTRSPRKGWRRASRSVPTARYYVSELKGFPAPLGDVAHLADRARRASRALRRRRRPIRPCTLVADGFTSIVDLTFGPDGTAYVTELDEASWFAVEVVHRRDGGRHGEHVRPDARGCARRRRPD